MNNFSNTSSSFRGTPIAIYQTVQAYGHDADEIFREAGLNISQFEDAERRISHQQLDQLLLRCVEHCKDPLFGIRIADLIHPTSFDALGLSLLSSSTLKDFCNRAVRYFALITTNEKLHFSLENGNGVLSDTPVCVDYHPSTRRVQADAWTTCMMRLIRFMITPTFAPQEIELMWPAPKGFISDYQRYFGCPIIFESTRNAIHISEKDLNKTLPAANENLAWNNDQIVLELLAKIDEADLPSQVETKIISLLPSGECSKEMIAQSLAMSVSSLHCKLSKSETSYQELLNEARKQLSGKYIKRSDLSITPIAFLLGFDSSSNFSRSFKRWWGQTPSEYKKSNKYDKSDGQTE